MMVLIVNHAVSLPLLEPNVCRNEEVKYIKEGVKLFYSDQVELSRDLTSSFFY